MQTKYIKGNKYIIYLEIMKYAIYAKSPHPNSVFCLNLEFFYHFPPSRIVKSQPPLKWYYSKKRPVCKGNQGNPKNDDQKFSQFLLMKMHLQENKNGISRNFPPMCNRIC